VAPSKRGSPRCEKGETRRRLGPVQKQTTPPPRSTKMRVVAITASARRPIGTSSTHQHFYAQDECNFGQAVPGLRRALFRTSASRQMAREYQSAASLIHTELSADGGADRAAAPGSGSPFSTRSQAAHPPTSPGNRRAMGPPQPCLCARSP
jgi:hypothetical protein